MSAEERAPAGDPGDLAALQRWLLSQITQQPMPDRTPPEWSVGEVVQTSRTFSAEDRLAVYQHAYLARLREVLRDEYPVLCRALGSELFDQFALDYLRAHPPTSYTLGRLADRFVTFLEQSRPATVSGPDLNTDPTQRPGHPPDWTDYLIDLARLETVVNQVFDGPGEEDREPLEGAALSRLSPELFAQSRLELAKSLQLVTLRFPLHAHFSALVRGKQPALPEPAPQTLAVWRHKFRVQRLPVDPVAARLLSLLQAGHAMGEGLQSLVTEQPAIVPTLGTLIPAWFQSWAQRGWIVKVQQESGISSTTGEPAGRVPGPAADPAAGPPA
jgi:hypothetical protein